MSVKYHIELRQHCYYWSVYGNVQRSRATPQFVIFCLVSLITVLQAFWRSLKGFLWTLAPVSLIFSPLLAPDHFLKDVFKCLSHLTLTKGSDFCFLLEWFKLKQWKLSIHNVQLGKEATLNCIALLAACAKKHDMFPFPFIISWKIGTSQHDVQYVLKKFE